MSIRDLEKGKYNFQSLDEFKSFVLKAIDDEGYFLDFGYVLDEKYTDSSDNNNHIYRAVITCFKCCHDKETQSFKSGYNKLNSVDVYDFFYTNSIGYGSFIIKYAFLGYNALKAIRSLSE